MSTSTQQESPQGTAKIYQFPVRARAVVSDRRGGGHVFLTPSVSDAALSACWYHEAALTQPAVSTEPLR